MKNLSPKKSPTLGQFIAQVYDACGERKASGFVRLAIKARLIEFRDQQPVAIS
jgi:hypothetical protein